MPIQLLYIVIGQQEAQHEEYKHFAPHMFDSLPLCESSLKLTSSHSHSLYIL